MALYQNFGQEAIIVSWGYAAFKTFNTGQNFKSLGAITQDTGSADWGGPAGDHVTSLIQGVHGIVKKRALNGVRKITLVLVEATADAIAIAQGRKPMYAGGSGAVTWDSGESALKITTKSNDDVYYFILQLIIRDHTNQNDAIKHLAYKCYIAPGDETSRPYGMGEETRLTMTITAVADIENQAGAIDDEWIYPAATQAIVADGAGTKTTIIDSVNITIDDQYNNWFACATSGSNDGEAIPITDTTASGNTATTSDEFSVATASADTFTFVKPYPLT